MLVHLSNTSPYVCDLNRGPIEGSNRMASAPTKEATALLAHRESLPKTTRTPLKLLAPDEVTIDTTATDINASLQPIWYSEQTIVDDLQAQQDDIASIIQEAQQQSRSLLPRSTLPTIPSESPSMFDDEPLLNQTSLMHKSSTFTIDASTIADSPLNDSEKENTTNQVLPSTDDSFLALEQLLGLGSNTTVRDSPKTNHDTLSLTVVTPTDIINATTTSLRMSIAPKSGSDSLPSSQNLPTMPTIESINSTNPPSFLIENTTIEGDATSTTLNEQNSFENEAHNDDDTNFSFELNDFQNNSKNESMVDVPPPPAPAMAVRAPTFADVAYRALIKTRTGGRASQPVKVDSPLAEPNKLRLSAPTSRMLRSSCRRISTETSSADNQSSEPTTECFVNNSNTDSAVKLVEIASVPEEDEIEQEKSSSVTLNLSSPQVTEEFSTPAKPMMPILSREYTYKTPNERASERDRSMMNSACVTTNHEEPNLSMMGVLLTKPAEVEPNVRKSARKTSSIASKSMLEVLLTQPIEAESKAELSTPDSPSVASKSMLGVLLTKPAEVEPNVRKSARKTSSIASKSMLEVLLTQPTEPESKAELSTPDSPSIASKSMLGVLLTQPTEAESSIQIPTRESPSVVSKSMLNVLLTQPTETLTLDSPLTASQSVLGVLLTNPTESEAAVGSSPVRNSIRKTARFSRSTPKASINPLYSSTPSRQKSIQIVSIDEGEQVCTIVPETVNSDAQEIEIIQLNQAEASIAQAPILRTAEMGVQTTPSLDISSRRRLNILEQQATPIVQMTQSSSIVIVNDEKQITPLQNKLIMNLQRNVRFQLTPTTDARLFAREQLEENLRGLKPDIPIEATPVISEPSKPAPVKTATKGKKKVVASKKKKTPPKQKQPIEKKTRQTQKEKPNPAPKKSAPIKRLQRKPRTVEVAAPTKRSERKPRAVQVTALTKRPERKQSTSVKRVPRKRTIPEVTIEPVIKRMKASKPVEIAPKPEKDSNDAEKIALVKRTRSRSRNITKTIAEPKTVTKTSKRRLQSADKTEGIKKKALEEKIPLVQKSELSEEERQKIKALTVARLKSRLNTHKADIPKGAKKADLIALLIQTEANLLQGKKSSIKKPAVASQTTMTTRRRKN